MQYPVESSGTISKDIIRQRGQLCADRLKQELKIIDGPVSDGEDAQVQMRTHVTKIVKSDCADLTRFEQGLVCQYVLHEISAIERADVWLDGLPPLSIDEPGIDKTAHLFRRQTAVFGLPVLRLITAILPSVEESREFIKWSRSNRAWMRTAVAAVFGLVGGVDGLVYEILQGSAHANWVPPAILLAVGLCFLALAVFGAPAEVHREAVVKTGIVAAALGGLLLAVTMLCHAPTAVGAGVFFVTIILTPFLALMFTKHR